MEKLYSLALYYTFLITLCFATVVPTVIAQTRPTMHISFSEYTLVSNEEGELVETEENRIVKGNQVKLTNSGAAIIEDFVNTYGVLAVVKPILSVQNANDLTDELLPSEMALEVSRTSDGSSIPNHGMTITEVNGEGDYFFSPTEWASFHVDIEVPHSLFDELPLSVTLVVNENAISNTDGLGNEETSFEFEIVKTFTETTEVINRPIPTVRFYSSAFNRDGGRLEDRGHVRLANNPSLDSYVNYQNDDYGYIKYEYLFFGIGVSPERFTKSISDAFIIIVRKSDGSYYPGYSGIIDDGPNIIIDGEIDIIDEEPTLGEIDGPNSISVDTVVESSLVDGDTLDLLTVTLKVGRSFFAELPITIDILLTADSVLTDDGVGNLEFAHSLSVVRNLPSDSESPRIPITSRDPNVTDPSPTGPPLTTVLDPPSGTDNTLNPTIIYYETALDDTVIEEAGFVKLTNKLSRGLANLESDAFGYISYEINFGPTISPVDKFGTSELIIVSVKSSVDDSVIEEHGIVVDKITHNVRRLGYFIVDLKVPHSVFDELPWKIELRIKKHAVRTTANQGNAASSHTIRVVASFASEVLEESRPEAEWTYYDLTLDGSVAGSQGLVKLTDAWGNRLVDLETDAHGYLSYEVTFGHELHSDETLEKSELSIVGVKSTYDDSAITDHGIVIDKVTHFPRGEDYWVVDIKVPRSLFDNLPLTIDVRINANAVRSEDGIANAALPYTIIVVAEFPPSRKAVFSEFMFETTVSGVDGFAQWIEVYNSSDEPLNLKDWSLVSEKLTANTAETTNTSETTVFQTDFIIPAHQTRLLVTGLARHSSGGWALLDDSVYELSISPVIVRGGFSVKLLDAEDMLVDEISTRDSDEHTWNLPDCIINGFRTSLIRRFDKQAPRSGTAATGWIRASDMGRLPHGIYYGHAEDISTPGYQQDLHAPVLLSHFSARFIEGAAVIRWTTEAELNNAGFNILRSTSRIGEFRRVNAQLIQGAGTTGQRTEYTWTDTTVKPNVVYYYRIEDVDFSGERRLLKTQKLQGMVSPSNKLITTWGAFKKQ